MLKDVDLISMIVGFSDPPETGGNIATSASGGTLSSGNANS